MKKIIRTTDGIVGDGAVADRHRAVVGDATARADGVEVAMRRRPAALHFIHAERAILDCRRATVGDATAGGVARRRRRPAHRHRGIPAERAIVDCHRAGVVDATALRNTAIGTNTPFPLRMLLLIVRTPALKLPPPFVPPPPETKPFVMEKSERVTTLVVEGIAT